MQYFGLDFGTTNSSLSWVGSDGKVELCSLDLTAVNPRVLRSLLYYSLDRRGFVVGQRAIDEYLQEDMQGTLIQSIKTFLADDSFEETFVHDRFYRLEDLIAFFFQAVHQVIRSLTDDDIALVVGRPAVFVDRPEREQLAQGRMRRAAQLGKFYDISFQYEPIAAGLAYESTLRAPELALIADLGGGTSDFTVMRLGSGNQGDRRHDILASGGVYVGGDTFDARIMAIKLTPYFGGASTFRSMEGKAMPFPKPLLAQLSRWHHVGFLRNARAREQLRRIRWTSSDPDAIDALQELIESNCAFFLFQEIERAKTALSHEQETTLRFRRDSIDIEERLTRTELEQLIAPDIAAIESSMASTIAAAALRPSDISSVFLTGGSAQIPAIRALFERTFGADKLRAQDYLTSVAFGLGYSAATLSRFPGSAAAC
ncbi:MAG TPA: Hsp70 family protein [Terriglobales bacterium]|nr:Hsp70 family protein [Terriglobales bacterium]